MVGHKTDIERSPATFGLDFAPTTKADLDRAFHDLWARGWVRGRFSVESATISLQPGRPTREALHGSQELVGRFAEHIRWVQVDFGVDGEPATFTLDEFMEGRWPSSWGKYGANPRRGRR